MKMTGTYFLRGVFSFSAALLITGFLCMLAPLISREHDVSFTDPIEPIRILPLPTLENKKEKQKRQPRQIEPLPTIPKPPVTKRQPLEKLSLTMKPLKIELPAMRAASIPAAPPQADQKMEGGLSGVAGDGIYDLEAVDSPPKLQKYVPPLFPAAAKGKGIEGKVVIRCTVTTKGRVKDAKIISAEPPGYFEKASLKAVAKWTFIAAKFQGEQVPVYVDIPLSFSLD